jgi:hypothetical protein
MNDINFEPKDIVNYLIILYAIVPSIVITVMYSFLSNIEIELGRVWKRATREANDLKKAAEKVDKFVIISAKAFHFGMAYYLILLFSALLPKCLSLSTKKSILGGSIFFLIYFVLYFLADARKSFKARFDSASEKERLLIQGLIIGMYGVFPLLVFLLFYLFKCNELTFHLGWITLTIFHLLVWWLVVPFVYKPLTYLSKIIRNLDS